jgi:hypothetical protein
MFSGVSTNGSSAIIVQIGSSSGIETSSYSGAFATLAGGASGNGSMSSGFMTASSMSSSSLVHGALTLTLLTGTTWVANGNIAVSNASRIDVTSGSKSIAATLDRVRITTVNGTDTFDAGTVNIIMES